MFTRVILLLTFGMLASGTAVGGDTTNESLKVIRGEVWYREKMLLPPGSELYIALEDVAKMDVAAELVASERFPLEGGPPYPFQLNYSSQRLQDRGQYALRARIENDGKLLFINTERIPAFESSVGQPVKIRVDRVASVGGTGDDGKKPDASLTNTYWKLVKMNDKPVTTASGQREIHMVLDARQNMRGYAGCNWMRGGYVLGGQTLQFPPAMVTRRACRNGMEQESALLAHLLEVQRYTISGDSMALYSGDGRLILSFEAVYLY